MEPRSDEGNVSVVGGTPSHGRSFVFLRRTEAAKCQIIKAMPERLRNTICNILLFILFDKVD